MGRLTLENWIAVLTIPPLGQKRKLAGMGIIPEREIRGIEDRPRADEPPQTPVA